MWLWGEPLHALSTRSTRLNLSALSASPRLCVRYLEAARRRFPQSNGHHDGRAMASICPPMAWIFPPKNDSIFSNMSVQYLHAPSPECAIVCSKFINSPHTIPPVSPICRAWVRSPHPLAQRADMIPNSGAKLRHELLTDINNRDKCGFGSSEFLVEHYRITPMVRVLATASLLRTFQPQSGVAVLQ